MLNIDFLINKILTLYFKGPWHKIFNLQFFRFY